MAARTFGKRNIQIFIDPRFIACVKSSMKQSCRFWYVIIYDEGRPVRVRRLGRYDDRPCRLIGSAFGVDC